VGSVWKTCLSGIEKAERIVKQNGKVKFKGKWYHMGKKMSWKST